MHTDKRRFGEEKLDAVFGEIIAFEDQIKYIGDRREMIFYGKIFQKADEETDEIGNNNN